MSRNGHLNGPHAGSKMHHPHKKITSKKKEKSQDTGFSLLNFEAKAKENLWDFNFVTAACCCGLCVPNMIITKAKNTWGSLFAFPLRKRKQNKISRFFIEFFRGRPRRGRQLYFTFPGAPDPLFKASKAPFLTLRVATPSWGHPSSTA